MPGKIAPPRRSFATRLSRNSSFTRRLRKRCSENGLWRSSPNVRGKLMMENPRGNSLWERLYARHAAMEARAFLPRYSVKGRGRPSLHRREENCSVGVPVATGPLTHVHGPSQVGENSLKVGNDGLDALGFRLHAQQGLFEIEIQRECADKMEGDL